MLKVVKRNFDNGHELTLDGVVNVEKRDGELCVVITKQNNLYINRVPIPVYVFSE